MKTQLNFFMSLIIKRYIKYYKNSMKIYINGSFAVQKYF